MEPRSPMPRTITAPDTASRRLTIVSMSAVKRRTEVARMASLEPTVTTAMSGRRDTAASNWPSTTSRAREPPTPREISSTRWLSA